MIGPRANLDADCSEPKVIKYAKTSDLQLNSQIKCLRRIVKVSAYVSNDDFLFKEGSICFGENEKIKKFENGHYQIGLPWKPSSPQLIDSNEQAKVRLNYLKKQLTKNRTLLEK